EPARGGDSQAPPLADGIAVVGIALSQLGSVAVDEDGRGAVRRREAPGRRRDLGLDELPYAARDEADLHALPLLGDREAGLAGERADLRLGHAAEREHRGRQLLRGQLEQVVALVLLRVRSGVELRPFGAFEDPRIVAGRDPLGAEGARPLPEEIELDPVVAGDALARGAPGEGVAD